jgi:NADH-quinone oxidoreductase subunit L
MTAFYMFRLVVLTFGGKERFDHHHLHPHEAPKTMTIPLVILAALSVLGGFFGVPKSLGGGNLLEHWLEPVFEPANRKLMIAAHEGGDAAEYLFMALSVAIAGAGIWAALTIYRKRTDIADTVANRLGGLYRLLVHKYFVDEAYDAAVVMPIVNISDHILWKGVDVAVIDGTVNGSATLVGRLAAAARRVQTGVAQSYALVFATGILLLITWLLFS